MRIQENDWNVISFATTTAHRAYPLPLMNRGCWTFHLVLVHVVRLRRIASDFGVIPLPELRNTYFANVDHPSVTLPFMFADRHLPYRGDGNFGIFVSLGRAFVPRPISKS